MTARDRHNLHESSYPPAQAFIGGERRGRPEHSPEGLDCLVDYRGGQLALILDDGERLTFDAAEFASVLYDVAPHLFGVEGVREAA